MVCQIPPPKVRGIDRYLGIFSRTPSKPLGANKQRDRCLGKKKKNKNITPSLWEEFPVGNIT
jgi:hypothetical protein